MAYQVAWTPTARRALSKLSEKVAVAVVEFVYAQLAEKPQRVGKALRFELTGLHSARRGDFRVIYRIREEPSEVTILAIEHRSDVYRPH